MEAIVPLAGLLLAAALTFFACICFVTWRWRRAQSRIGSFFERPLARPRFVSPRYCNSSHLQAIPTISARTAEANCWQSIDIGENDKFPSRYNPCPVPMPPPTPPPPAYDEVCRSSASSPHSPPPILPLRTTSRRTSGEDGAPPQHSPPPVYSRRSSNGEDQY